MLRRLASVGGFTLLSRAAGFARDVIMADVLGSGPLSDAFFVAWRLPNSFRGIFAEGAFNVAFIPRYAAARETKGEEQAADFADNVYSWQMAAQIVLLAAALACMFWIVRIMAPGFAAIPGQTALATALSRITFPYLILTVIAVQLSAMLNAHGKFSAAAAWSIFLNLTMIATLKLVWLFPNAAYAAAAGVLIAGFVQYVFIVWAAARSRLRLRLQRPRWTPEARNFLAALGAATLGSASVQIALFFDTLIASFYPGVLTAVNYADRIDQLPLGTLGIALATVLLPEMSSLIAKGDQAGAHAAQNRSAALGLFLTLPFAAAFVLVPHTIMRGIFAHGAFSLEAADVSAMALAGYGVGLPAFVMVRVIAATFYARHDTATPVRATMLAVVVNVGLKFLLVMGLHWGALGVALGTSFGSWANVALLVLLAHRRGLLKLDATFRAALLPSFLAAAASAGAALAAAVAAPHFIPGNGLLQREAALGLAMLSGLIVYTLVGIVFRRRLPLGALVRT
ncbi:MAG: murein biosynthesis integral membrane protein MurJ [Alphaproteobacteria bacterium]|nr:murein biosynthesis integral membrane protein MurJ [Alphaproteobacteria bacterium]MBV9694692.1 murein biosynthesis integral membrane protein MurJ [Alphaproteobacteria bacterium]